MPAIKEQIGLSRLDGKRQDEATLLPWPCGKLLAWYVTVRDTFAVSHNQFALTSAYATAAKAAANNNKCDDLATTHQFAPLMLKQVTHGVYNLQNPSSSYADESYNHHRAFAITNVFERL